MSKPVLKWASNRDTRPTYGSLERGEVFTTPGTAGPSNTVYMKTESNAVQLYPDPGKWAVFSDNQRITKLQSSIEVWVDNV